MRLGLPVILLAAAGAAVLLATGTQATYDPSTYNMVEIRVPDADFLINGTARVPLVISGVANNTYVVPNEMDEDQPINRDPRGDHNVVFEQITAQADQQSPNDSTGTDIGNIWIGYDDGQRFDVYMRLYEEPYVTTDGATVTYQVMFYHPALDGSSVVNGTTTGFYRLEARQDSSNNWLAWLGVEFDDGNPTGTLWCKGGDLRPIEAHASMHNPGYQIVWNVDYADLNVANTSSYRVYAGASGSGSSQCAEPSAPGGTPGIHFGQPAQVGDVLTQWQGRSVYRAADSGLNPLGPSAGGAVTDATDPPINGQYTLGPLSDPYPNALPQVVKLYINGYLVAQPVVNTVNGAWTASIDMRQYPSYDCLYQVTATFQTNNVWTVSDTTPVTDQRYYGRLDFCVYGDRQFRAPPPSAQLQDAGAPPQTAVGARGTSSDDDLDGFGNANENCPYVHDTQSGDHDNDRVGDACDPDIDGDGITNAADNCPMEYNPLQEDRDHDQRGDHCEGSDDIDGDGWSNARDNCPRVRNDAQADMDRDGIGDFCDEDADGDGTPNIIDLWDTDPRECCDNDGDGIGDNADPDDDNDGFSDKAEIAAGTDPFDASSRPRENIDASRLNTEASVGVGPFGTAGILVGLVLVGALLFVFARRK